MTKETIFECCVTLDASEVLNERQVGWSGRWSLMGDFVFCTQCLAAQAIDLAHEPFENLPDCVSGGYGLHPWHELQCLLSMILPLNTRIDC